MDPRSPTPFMPRPDTGGASADYIRAQAREAGDQTEHAVADHDDFGDDAAPDRGPALIALLFIVLAVAVALITLAILGSAS